MGNEVEKITLSIESDSFAKSMKNLLIEMMKEIFTSDKEITKELRKIILDSAINYFLRNDLKYYVERSIETYIEKIMTEIVNKNQGYQEILKKFYDTNWVSTKEYNIKAHIHAIAAKKIEDAIDSIVNDIKTSFRNKLG